MTSPMEIIQPHGRCRYSNRENLVNVICPSNISTCNHIMQLTADRLHESYQLTVYPPQVHGSQWRRTESDPPAVVGNIARSTSEMSLSH